MLNEPILEKREEQKTQTVLDPDKWVDMHADYLFSYALKRLNDEEQARDLVQETFLAALEKGDGFRGESNERTWLTAILKYKIIDIYRKNARTPVRINLATFENEEEFFDPDLNNWKKEHWPQPFGVEENDALNNKEFANILQKCMKKLPGLWISVFTMKHVDGELSEKICKELNLSATNYWVIMHRAKVNLRSCLQKNWLS